MSLPSQLPQPIPHQNDTWYPSPLSQLSLMQFLKSFAPKALLPAVLIGYSFSLFSNWLLVSLLSFINLSSLVIFPLPYCCGFSPSRIYTSQGLSIAPPPPACPPTQKKKKNRFHLVHKMKFWKGLMYRLGIFPGIIVLSIRTSVLPFSNLWIAFISSGRTCPNLLTRKQEVAGMGC